MFETFVGEIFPSIEWSKISDCAIVYLKLRRRCVAGFLGYGYLGTGDNEDVCFFSFIFVVLTVAKRLAVCLLILELSDLVSAGTKPAPISSSMTRLSSALRSFNYAVSTSFILATISLCRVTLVSSLYSKSLTHLLSFFSKKANFSVLIYISLFILLNSSVISRVFLRILQILFVKLSWSSIYLVFRSSSYPLRSVVILSIFVRNYSEEFFSFSSIFLVTRLRMSSLSYLWDSSTFSNISFMSPFIL